MRFAATAALIALALAAPSAARAAGPTTLPAADAERLRATLPVVRSSDPAVKSIHVRAHVRTLADSGAKLDIVMEAWYQSPDAYASRYIDGTDGTPLFAASAGHGALVYAALDQYVLLIPTGNPTFELRGEGHTFNLNVGLEGDNKPHPPVVVDLRSLFPADGGRTVAEDLGGGSRRLTHTSDKGNRMSAVVRPDGTVTDVALADKGGKTSFTLDAFEVDAPIPAAAFDLPSRDALAAARLKTADAGDGLATVEGLIKMMMKDLAVHAGARNPALREQFKSAFPADTNWSRVAAEDAKASAALRELLAASPSAENLGK